MSPWHGSRKARREAVRRRAGPPCRWRRWRGVVPARVGRATRSGAARGGARHDPPAASSMPSSWAEGECTFDSLRTICEAATPGSRRRASLPPVEQAEECCTVGRDAGGELVQCASDKVQSG